MFFFSGLLSTPPPPRRRSGTDINTRELRKADRELRDLRDQAGRAQSEANPGRETAERAASKLVEEVKRLEQLKK